MPPNVTHLIAMVADKSFLKMLSRNLVGTKLFLVAHLMAMKTDQSLVGLVTLKEFIGTRHLHMSYLIAMVTYDQKFGS